VRPYLKNNLKQNKDGGVAQVVQALSSNSSTAKNKERNLTSYFFVTNYYTSSDGLKVMVLAELHTFWRL
jgi:hypothetical protein